MKDKETRGLISLQSRVSDPPYERHGDRGGGHLFHTGIQDSHTYWVSLHSRETEPCCRKRRERVAIPSRRWTTENGGLKPVSTSSKGWPLSPSLSSTSGDGEGLDAANIGRASPSIRETGGAPLERYGERGHDNPPVESEGSSTCKRWRERGWQSLPHRQKSDPQILGFSAFQRL